MYSTPLIRPVPLEIAASSCTDAGRCQQVGGWYIGTFCITNPVCYFNGYGGPKEVDLPTGHPGRNPFVHMQTNPDLSGDDLTVPVPAYVGVNQCNPYVSFVNHG